MPPSALHSALDALEQDRLDGLHPGGQLYVCHRDRVEADLAFGEAAPGEPMRTDHRTLWLSAGKPITAVAVARMWERGELGLDDPVTRFVPEFGVGGKEAVTIRHLLTHTAGIRSVDLRWPKASWDEVLDRICNKKLEPRWTPGRTAGYHRLASWFVLGEILRRLSGEPVPVHLRRTVLEPLGMTGSWVGMTQAALDEETIAPLWDTAASPPVEHRWARGRFLTEPGPGANAVGPVRELGRFYEMLLGGGTLDGVQLLRPQTVEAMTARQRAGAFDKTFRRRIDWGLGFVLDSKQYGEETTVYGYGSHCSPRTFGHSGSRSSAAFADPEHRLVVALAVNGTPAEDVHRHSFHRVLSSIYEDLGLVEPDPEPTARRRSG